MAGYLAYTVFTDEKLTTVRATYNAYSNDADRTLAIFRRALRREPCEGDVIWGCRIDRIGSEHQGA